MNAERDSSPRLMTDVRFNPGEHYPRGPDIYYECLRCRCLIPSNPPDNGGCICNNVFVDIDAYRVAVEDERKFRVVRIANAT